METLISAEQKQSLSAYREWIQKELDSSLRFWLENGMDKEHGGIYTCMKQDGTLFSKDKGVWMQGRSAWTFSRLCTLYGSRPEWLEAAKSCIDFMETNCFDRKTGRMYLILKENGEQVSQHGQCFSEAFYTIGNAEYGAATGDESALERARKAYELVWQLNHGLMVDPNNPGAKTIVDGKPGRAHADPMIYLNVSAILRRCDPENAALYRERAATCAEEIIQYHFKPDLRCTLEKVAQDGTVCNEEMESRMVNPGHDIECSWFLMEEANAQGNAALHKQAEQIFRYAVEAGWDKEQGGLYGFLDYRDSSILPVFMGDKKTWWTHCEMLVASLMLYRDTGEEQYWHWFETVLNYCKTHFSDPQYGDWYAQVEMDGTVADHHCKGNVFKGPFHLPRMLIRVEQMLSELLES